MMKSRIIFLLVIFTVVTSSGADGSTYYNNEADFLAAAPVALNMESFETLPVSGGFQQHSELILPDFVLNETESLLSVHNIPNEGVFATDGDKYVRDTNGFSMTLSFTQPQNIFGINIIDWGDRAEAGTLVFNSNIGHTYEIASGPHPSGTVLFCGVISDLPFTEVTLMRQESTNDSWAVDEAYYGIPEPCTLVLLGLGGITLVRRRGLRGGRGGV